MITLISFMHRMHPGWLKQSRVALSHFDQHRLESKIEGFDDFPIEIQLLQYCDFDTDNPIEGLIFDPQGLKRT